jgi:hypothetical protein
MPNYNYRCDECCEIETVFCSYEERDEPKQCSTCDQMMDRTWEDSAPVVMRAALPDGNGRFAHLKTFNKLKQARQNAKSRGDQETYQAAKREISKLGDK